MQEEIEGLKWNGTSFDCHLPPGRKAICGKWVYRWKTDEHRGITRAKSGLVAFGYQQKEKIDRSEKKAATPNAASIRLLLATAVKQGLPLCHFDVKQAFVI